MLIKAICISWIPRVHLATPGANQRLLDLFGILLPANHHRPIYKVNSTELSWENSPEINFGTREVRAMSLWLFEALVRSGLLHIYISLLLHRFLSPCEYLILKLLDCWINVEVLNNRSEYFIYSIQLIKA